MVSHSSARRSTVRRCTFCTHALPSLMPCRSSSPTATPAPSSKCWEIIGPLTDPRSHGGNPADAFHVVAPSVPGFGFSVPVGETGWDMPRTARAFAELMRRLGYERYGAQGSDIGAGVAGMLASIDPSHVIGVHATTDPTSFIILGSEIPIDTSGLSDGRARACHAPAGALPGGERLPAAAIESTPDAGLFPDRLTSWPIGLDCGAVQGVDQPGRDRPG